MIVRLVVFFAGHGRPHRSKLVRTQKLGTIFGHSGVVIHVSKCAEQWKAQVFVSGCIQANHPPLFYSIDFFLMLQRDARDVSKRIISILPQTTLSGHALES